MEPRFSFDSFAERFRQLAFLHPGLTILLKDHRDGVRAKERFHHPEGIADGLRWFMAGLEPVHATLLRADGQLVSNRVSIALGWYFDTGERVWGFANGFATREGGTHMTGFRDALTRAVRQELRSRPTLLRGRDLPEAHVIRSGLGAIIAVDLVEPYLSGATRDRLRNPEAKGLVRDLTRSCVESFFRKHPDECEAILEHILARAAVRPSGPP